VTGWAEGAAALLLLAPAATGADGGSDGGPDAGSGVVDHEVLFWIADPAVHESSGLVDRGRVLYTVNDSGSEPVLYALDPRNGETLATTSYADEVEDTEALAPGRGPRVWVGDIGDNLERRESVVVYDVRPGRPGGRRFELSYADGPRDAEALLAHPRSGRLFVVSKRVFGGVVYAAPRSLAADRINQLTPFARVPGLVTGGEFMPDGDHVVLRTYGTASVFTFPAFELVGTVTLPDQEQGEALSVSRDGGVLVSSEGIHAEVLRVDLPAGLIESETTSSASPTPSASPSAAAPDPGTSPAAGDGDRDAPPGRSEGFDLRDGFRLAAGLVLVALIGWRLRRRWRRHDR
jgi:hypothetical protein